jgi:hypothetical protein
MSSIPETVQLSFDVDEDVVSLRLQNGERVALFPSDRLAPFNLEHSLQQAVATIMQDLDEPEAVASIDLPRGRVAE